VLLPHVDYWFAASEEIRDYLMGRLGVPSTHCEVLTNGIETASDEDNHRIPGGPDPDTFTIIQVARVTPQKSQLTAVAIAERLQAKVASFRWLIVGRNDSAYARQCHAEAKRAGLAELVQFLGECADVRPLVRSAHVGVLTSRFEGMPLALLEYMAAGLAVVVTDVGDAGATVRASGGGRAVPIGDIEGFAAALAEYAGDPGAVASAGRRNRALVSQAYGVEAMVHRVAGVYRAVTARPQDGGAG
jgi:glycosyltransferase involved in cell wall biosynthesis